eukprot:1928574-Prymnesium_polylepis.1
MRRSAWKKFFSLRAWRLAHAGFTVKCEKVRMLPCLRMLPVERMLPVLNHPSFRCVPSRT